MTDGLGATLLAASLAYSETLKMQRNVGELPEHMASQDSQEDIAVYSHSYENLRSNAVSRFYLFKRSFHTCIVGGGSWRRRGYENKSILILYSSAVTVLTISSISTGKNFSSRY
jgi:hypothetical protein